MELSLKPEIARDYKGPQKVRVITEKWFEDNMYCPACPSSFLERTPPNTKVVDFICPKCGENYQMKSMSHPFGFRVMDSAYEPKINSIKNGTSPNFVFMHYNRTIMSAQDVMIVPKYFVSPDIIERRKPLKPNARRAGWVGSNILLGRLPIDARISLVINGFIVSEETVRKSWKRFSFLREISVSSKGWLTDVLACVRKLEKIEFMLDEMYSFEESLRKMHPRNKHIKPKIRQQLQILRDRGILEFLGDGRYRIIR
ncbi:MAG: DpnI domain-containing protein [Candidatus Thermoplasmatota archaeon]|nr:DpnI domain-containing protein [Candidatus Thermoplasmatota archaeon]